jgi:ankyrin repeat protein
MTKYTRTQVAYRTALMWAAHKGHLNCVKMLLKNGADRDLRDEHGQKAEDMAKTDLVKEALTENDNNQ